MATPIFYRKIRYRVRKFLRRHDFKNEARLLPMRFFERVMGQKRYIPKIEWSENSWTHNMFRFYEVIFGRTFGIRREALVRSNLDSEGRLHIERRFFTCEAVVAHFEGEIRAELANIGAFVRGDDIPYFYIPRPALAVLTIAVFGFEIKMSGHSAFAPMFAGALARDNYTGAFTGTASTSHTVSHTVSGSDRLLLVGSYAGTNNTTQSGVTYSGASMTGLDTGKYNANNSWVYDWYKTAPATGANNVVVSYNQSCYHGTVAASYTGVDQTSPINANGSTSGGNTNNLTKALTSTVANVWGVAFMEGSNCDPALITVNNSLSFEMAEQGDGTFAADSNGGLGATGSKTMGWTQSTGSNLNGMVAVLIAPTTSTDVTASPSVLAATFSIPASTQTGTALVSPSVLAATFSVQSATELIDEFFTPAQPLTATFSLPTVNVITPDAQILVSAPLSAVFSAPAPSVSGGAPVSASVLVATFSQPSATFRGDVAPVPSVLAATFSTPAPTIFAIGNITVSPSVLAAEFSLQSTTVTAEQNASIAAGVLSATFSLQAVTVTAIQNVELTATTLVATFSVQTPRKVGGLWTAQPRVQGDWTPQPRAV